MKHDDMIALARKKRAEMDKAAAIIPVTQDLYDMLALRLIAAPATMKKLLPNIYDILQRLEDALKKEA